MDMVCIGCPAHGSGSDSGFEPDPDNEINNVNCYYYIANVCISIVQYTAHCCQVLCKGIRTVYPIRNITIDFRILSRKEIKKGKIE
jgi:hypothetical protein